NRFEVAFENKLTRAQLAPGNGHGISERNIRTIDLLHYHLRTLLHRNDALGMAASIETRFPFLDHELVKFAVNLPYHFKIRMTPSMLKGPLLTDKWVIRQVASRYIPPQLSHRKKLGFLADGFGRMRIAPEYFEKSPIADMFDLSTKEMKFFIESTN